MKDRWLVYGGTLLGAMVAVACFANGEIVTNDVPVREAPVMTVVAPPLVMEERVTDYGGSVSVVGREQMDASGAYDLQSALRKVSGVTISRFTLLGAFGGADGGSVYLRGRGTGRPGADITIYQDGVPRKVGVWDHPLMDSLALDHADTLHVYKGPQPAVHSGTFGSVDITSRRRVTPGTETEISVMAGERQTLLMRMHHGGYQDGFDYYGGLAHQETSGHRPHSAAELQSVYARAGAPLGKGFSLSAQVMATDNQVEDPGRVGFPVPERDRFGTRTVTTSARLDYQSERLDGWMLAYYEDGQIRWKQDRIGDEGSPAGSANTDWENYGLRTMQRLRFAVMDVDFGLEAASEGGTFENRAVSGFVPFSYEDRYRTITPAAGVLTSVSVASHWRLQPSLGLRYYSHNVFSDKTAPYAGVVLQGKEWTWFANAARGVNYPGVYASGVAAATVDQISAETLDHIEAGVQWRSPQERLMLGMSLFRDETDNLLQWTPAGLVNAGSSDVQGVEVVAHVRPCERWALYGSLTVLDPSEDKTPRAPEWSASLGVLLSLTSRLNLYTDLDAVASQYAFNGRAGAGERIQAEKVDRYVLGNLRLSYQPSWFGKERVTLFAACDNVGDVTYETLPGYPLPGRFYSGGVKLAF